MSFQDIINLIVPPTYSGGEAYYGGPTYNNDGSKNDFYAWKAYRNGWHYGIDLSYRNPNDPKSAESNLNATNPLVGAPESGVVTNIDPEDGFVEITDEFGYKHQIRHLDSILVQKKDKVTAGQIIGKMGGMDNGNPKAWGPHVDYKVKAPGNRYVNPEIFCPRRQLLGPNSPTQASRNNEAIAQGSRVPIPPVRGCDPLILDLDGDGVETISVNSGVRFDHNGDGFIEQTGWVDSKYRTQSKEHRYQINAFRLLAISR